MNKVIIAGRLTRDPDVRQAGETMVARYTVAVDRRFKREGEPTADFINCVAFGKAAEFADKWLRQGTKMIIVGRLQTGSYTNKDGVKVYTTDVVVEEQEFAESKRNADGTGTAGQEGQGSETATASTSSDSGSGTSTATSSDGFMNIPDGITEELPFT